jgi:hypothetical protein
MQAEFFPLDVMASIHLFPRWNTLSWLAVVVEAEISLLQMQEVVAVEVLEVFYLLQVLQ